MKKTTNFEPPDDSDMINNAYLKTNLWKIEVPLSISWKEHNEYRLLNDQDAKHLLSLEKHDKQSEEVLIDPVIKAIIQILHDKGLFDIHDNADEALKDYLPDKVNKNVDLI